MASKSQQPKLGKPRGAKRSTPGRKSHGNPPRTKTHGRVQEIRKKKEKKFQSFTPPTRPITIPKTIGKLWPKSLFPSHSADAPLAVSSSTTLRKMEMSGDMYTGITVRSCAPYVDLGDSIAPGTYQVGAMGLNCYQDASTINFQSACNALTLNPFLGHVIKCLAPSATTSKQYMGYPVNTQMANIAPQFTGYSVKRASLHYEPNASASNDRAMMVTFNTDPWHASYGIPGYYSGAEVSAAAPVTARPPLTPGQLENNVCVAFFAPWNAWSMDLPVQKDKKYFMYTTPVFTGALLYGLYNGAIVRESQWGIINAIMIGGNGGVAKLGRLWLDVTYELFDPSPISSSAAVLYATTKLLSNIKGHEYIEDQDDIKFNESKEEKKIFVKEKDNKAYYTTTTGPVTELKVTSDDDDYGQPDVISPPRYGTPVAIPGSALYIPSSTPHSQKVASTKGTSPKTKKK